MQDIISLNALEPAENGVFVPADKKNQPFAYSDGAQTEQYLYQVLSAADDLGSRSAELQSAIRDWPSEYHLSSDRSNLLRPYNFSGVTRVLELGSGCGAISRYLGEQGFIVDAVEGSAIRAGLGQLRCRDLNNVRVINANYNDLQFPTDHYDLVLFVGVIEYAKKFHPDAQTDRDAALKILRQAGSFINGSGAVFVAIENRLGLKYLLGAHEDHYARKYVGINNYAESAGIATYNKPQWSKLIEQAGFAYRQFSYPFPDYKIPAVVLSEQYADSNRYASNHLEGMVSRDYYAPVDRTPTEMMSWQAASQGGFLGDLTNSFSLLMGNDEQSLLGMQSFDFCHGPGRGRDNSFAVTTIKAQNSDLVEKRQEASADKLAPERSAGIQQVLAPQALIEGNLLSGQWLRTLLIYVRREEFEQSLKQYFDFLESEAQAGRLAIDLLPINIIVDPDGSWQVFDQEWKVEWTLTREYVYFRALLTFIVSNWVYLRDFLSWLELQTVRDFIEYGFHANRIHLSENLVEFIELENRFQRGIARDPDQRNVEQLLATVFDFSSEQDRVHSAVRWRDAESSFDEQAVVSMEVPLLPEGQTLAFHIKPENNFQILRFDPFDLRRAPDVGFFRVEQISLHEKSARETGVLWSLDSATAIAAQCDLQATVIEQTEDGPVWIATTDFPKLEFNLPEPISPNPDSTYQLVIKFAVVRTMEYALAYRHCLVEARKHQKQINRMSLNLTSLKEVSSHLEARSQAEEKRANRLQNDLENTQKEIEAIKQSKPFLLGTKIINMVNRMRGLIGR